MDLWIEDRLMVEVVTPDLAPAFDQAASDFAALVTDVNSIAVLGDDQLALNIYDMTTGPFGTLRAAKHLTISDGKVKTDTVVFDSHEACKTQDAEDSSV